MSLHLHRAARPDLLAGGLAALLDGPSADPFTAELVLVPARGVERWLSQRLSHVLGAGPGGDGVCAGVEFRRPASLIAEVLGIGEDDPWSREALIWPLLSVLDQNLDQPWCRVPAGHLGHFHDGDEAELRLGRRYAVARRLAELFVSYAAQRPELLAGWLDDAAGSGDLDADLRWQPPLWRALVAEVRAGAGNSAEAAAPPHLRHAAALERLRSGPTETLPQRLSLFGHTRLSRTDIELLEALAGHHDLHLWLPHPSDTLWQRLRGVHGSVPRSEADAGEAGHPLLQTLGRDLRELQRALPDPGPARAGSETVGSDEFLSGPAPPETLLGWLQSDIAADAVRPSGRRLGDDDRSVQVHACHGPARQIDVLRDVLLGLLDDDPTLEPRDIIVMCPDIESYAPLIEAGFGLGELTGAKHPAHSLRVRLADRAPVQTNPLLTVAADLLALAEGRTTAGQVLNLIVADPVRARFSFTDDDLDTVTRWVREANIRWGFDATHRDRYGLANIQHNTWRFGLDRILTGVAMSEDARAWLGTALPLDDVGSNQVETAGRLAEFIARLQHATDALSGSRPLVEWLDALADGVAALTRVSVTDGWQAGQLRRLFSDVRGQAGARCATPLRLADVRTMLSRELAGRPTRANFRAGALTVCTLVPMRSVPHRVVCLVGLDDGVFPRADHVDGDDVLARRPMTGERDRRAEDRQLLLDAVCAATETLVVTYTGADEHTGQRRPPAVPLAEVLDALDATTEAAVRDRITVAHPLQPFDIRNVTPGELGTPGRPFTFDPTAGTAAAAAAGRRSDPTATFTTRLPATTGEDVELPDVLTFFKDPVKGFFRSLDYSLPWEVEGVEDAMPVEIDALQTWAVADRMLADMLAGIHPDDAAHAEWRRGSLPPGQIGMRAACQLRDTARSLAEAALAHRSGEPSAHDVDVDLGAGRRLTGTVSGVYGDTVTSVTYSRLAPKHILASWITMTALAAQYPKRRWSALCIGRQRRGDRVRQRRFAPPPNPAAVLSDVIAVYDAGRCEPLPLPLATSYAWAEARRLREDPMAAAERAWTDKYGEQRADAHRKVWGADAPLRRLLGAPQPDETVTGEGTRLGALAMRLWAPLLSAEEL